MSRFLQNQDTSRGCALRSGQKRFQVGQAVAEIGLVVEVRHNDGGGGYAEEIDGFALRPFGDDRIDEFLIQLLVPRRADKGIHHQQPGRRAHAAAFLLAGFLAVAVLAVVVLVAALFAAGFLVAALSPALAFFSATDLVVAFLAGFLAGPLATRAAISPSASSSVIASGVMSLGSVALVLPCLT